MRNIHFNLDSGIETIQSVSAIETKDSPFQLKKPSRQSSLNYEGDYPSIGEHSKCLG